jgi:CSLREA domain-containing protein
MNDDDRIWSWTRRAAALLGLVGASWLLGGCEMPPATGFDVNTTVDGNDAVPGDGVCEMTAGAGDCSLRAAVDEANATTDNQVWIVVPPGTYSIDPDAVDEDANVGGDLDVDLTVPLTLVGQDAGAVIDAGGGLSGLDLHGGEITIRNLAITGAAGPGVVVRADTDLLVERSAVHGNAGGGIVSEAASTTSVLNTTISGNSPGIHNDGDLAVVYSTITANDAGGIVGNGPVSLGLSIVADQASGPDCAAAATSLDHNIDTDDTCGLDQPGDQPGVATAGLQTLTTDTLPHHPVTPGSVALDAVPVGPQACRPGGIFPDQLGAPRPQGGACDAGAVEMPAAVNLDVVVDDAGDTSDANPGDGLCADLGGSCTLRAAIDETNAYIGPDTVTIAPGVDPVLSIAGAYEDGNASGDLDIRDDLTLLGSGNTIDAGGHDRAIDAGPGASYDEFSDLHVEGVTITGGVTPPPSGLPVGGGAILYLGSGTLTVTDSTIEGNVSFAGGGIYADGPGGFAAVGNGGTYRIERTTISGNSAVGPYSMFPAEGLGGGLYLADGESYVVNSTVSGNSATQAGAGIYSGTSLNQPVDGTVHLQHSTVVGNTGNEALGRAYFTFFSLVEGGDYVLEASIIGSASAGACDQPSIPFVAASTGFNYVSDTSCGIAQPTDVEGAATFPTLGPLADNGGPTRTHLPAPGAPTIDLIPLGTPGRCDGTLPTDQRTIARPQGAACDVGAVEQ